MGLRRWRPTHIVTQREGKRSSLQAMAEARTPSTSQLPRVNSYVSWLTNKCNLWCQESIKVSEGAFFQKFHSMNIMIITYIDGASPNGPILDMKTHLAMQFTYLGCFLRILAHIRCTSACNSSNFLWARVTILLRVEDGVDVKAS